MIDLRESDTLYVCPICGSPKIDFFVINDVVVCRKCGKLVIPLATPQCVGQA